jgi:hypothetical protein
MPQGVSRCVDQRAIHQFMVMRHTYDELPKVIDPPNGFVHNTNDPPWNAAWPNTLDPTKYPPCVAAKTATFRAERSLRMLSEDPKITYDKFLEYKHSTRPQNMARNKQRTRRMSCKNGTGTPMRRAAAPSCSTRGPRASWGRCWARRQALPYHTI